MAFVTDISQVDCNKYHKMLGKFTLLMPTPSPHHLEFLETSAKKIYYILKRRQTNYSNAVLVRTWPETVPKSKGILTLEGKVEIISRKYRGHHDIFTKSRRTNSPGMISSDVAKRNGLCIFAEIRPSHNYFHCLSPGYQSFLRHEVVTTDH